MKIRYAVLFQAAIGLICLSAANTAMAQYAQGDNLIFINAAENGDASRVKALLANGADVNAKLKEGSTALTLASQNDHPDVVQVLLSKGADVNARDINGMTALLLASQQGHIAVVQELLSSGADANLKNSEGATALMRASFNRHRVVVQALLAKGAEVNTKTNDGRTALMLACFGGDRELMQALIDKGADVNAKTSNGRTALDAAVAGGHPELRVLLAQVAPARAAEVKEVPKPTITTGQPQAESAPAKFDGRYIGPPDVAPAGGACNPVSGVMLTIAKNEVNIIARRVVVMGNARYTQDTEYKGSVNERGEITAVASKQNWASTGIVRGDTFKGNIKNGDLMQQSGVVCTYNLELRRESEK